ncbi:MAG TPA: energy transducer TonB, partial [Xanthomarina sp.]|nr:energy transducer TonB [Xanthomarina sp.]
EFLADAEAVKYNKTQYYQNLLSQVFHTRQVSFINPFFKQSLIKKRIVMLQKSKSKQIQLVKYALLIPMVFGMLVYSSCSNENNANNLTEQVDLSQYTYTIKMGKDNPEDFKEKADASREFIINNPDYAQWMETDYTKQVPSITASVRHKDEKIPDGYSVEEVETKDGKKKTLVFGTIGEPKSKSIDSSDYDGKNEVPYTVIDEVPVFPGCDSQADEAGKKVCFNEGISNFVVKNFNADLAKTLDLKGSVKIFVFFKIDRQGNITEAKARAPKPELEVEAVRVVNMLPKMTPGRHDGKAVNVPYYLPIKFEINE